MDWLPSALGCASNQFSFLVFSCLLIALIFIKYVYKSILYFSTVKSFLPSFLTGTGDIIILIIIIFFFSVFNSSCNWPVVEHATLWGSSRSVVGSPLLHPCWITWQFASCTGDGVLSTRVKVELLMSKWKAQKPLSTGRSSLHCQTIPVERS